MARATHAIAAGIRNTIAAQRCTPRSRRGREIRGAGHRQRVERRHHCATQHANARAYPRTVCGQRTTFPATRTGTATTGRRTGGLGVTPRVRARGRACATAPACACATRRCPDECPNECRG